MIVFDVYQRFFSHNFQDISDLYDDMGEIKLNTRKHQKGETQYISDN